MLMLGHLHVGAGYPCRTVAELSNNHNGSVDTALRLVDAAVAAGADAIKLQTYSAEELVQLRGDGPAPAQWGAQGWTMRTLYDQAATSRAILEAVVRRCTEIGVPWFSSVFGTDSLARLELLGCPVYKIARLDVENEPLALAIEATKKPVLRSAFWTDSPVIMAADVFTLHCGPGYPTRPEDVQLPRDFGPHNPIGLSSHCLDPRLPIAAVALGAKLLEYHVQLRDEPSALEANISLDECQFAQMVRDVRATEALLA